MFPKSLILKTQLCVFVVATQLAAGSVEAAQEVGVLAMYKVSDSEKFDRAVKRLHSSVIEHGCRIRREGELSGTRGSLPLPDLDRFLLLQCETSMHSGRANMEFESLEPHTSEQVLLSGPSIFTDDVSDVSKRSYVIKLSQFNNKAPVERDQDLASLGTDAASRPHAFRNETVIDVDHTVGIPAPDDVTVLYYRSPEDAKAFRENNKDILSRIGEFNKLHVESFVYATGAAVR